MKHRNLLTLGLSLFLFATAMPAFSQVSNDNEDEVNKIDSRFGHDFVPGHVIVKMKDGAPAKVRRVQGKFKSAGISLYNVATNLVSFQIDLSQPVAME